VYKYELYDHLATLVSDLSVTQVASHYPLSQSTRIFVSSSWKAKTPRHCVSEPKKVDDGKA